MKNKKHKKLDSNKKITRNNDKTQQNWGKNEDEYEKFKIQKQQEKKYKKTRK